MSFAKRVSTIIYLLAAAVLFGAMFFSDNPSEANGVNMAAARAQPHPE
ncbi:hypothetical protein [Oceanicella actignis]|uniref:Uncharacterized protein n=1 Tax=Oceanicella actignis TaxID=1189325 RepID=A0A1M7TA91_9RHOB|nr:hypothetical protein [Oceanicella actignis]TYO89172.1 hypothetical protein LY05_01788 [Oceanicella actignis]SET52227.1 hypothetical protein SAMN04488119_105143 [Oceanicella actignis]SHN67650.1 hypothetical protein SAMN05216200_105142 [Oceanicella actignis]